MRQGTGIREQGAGEDTIALVLTRSEQMALIDVLIAYMRMPDAPQMFVDVARDRETTTPDLLCSIVDAPAKVVLARLQEGLVM